MRVGWMSMANDLDSRVPRAPHSVAATTVAKMRCWDIL